MKLKLGDVVVEPTHITTAKKHSSDLLTITFENGEELHVHCHKTPEKVAPGTACFIGSADELMDKILAVE